MLTRVLHRYLLPGWLVLLMMCQIPVVFADTLSITFDGINPDLQQHVLGYLAIERERSREEFLPSRLQRLHNQAANQIKTALQAFGYYRVKVEGDLQHGTEGWQAHYHVELGDAIPIGELNIAITGEGESDEFLQTRRDKFPIQPGMTFEHPQYESARDALVRAALDRGYLDAKLTTHSVEINMDRYRANINLILATGPRYRFGEVHFPDVNVNQDLLRRYVKIAPGDPYQPAELLKLQTALTDSGYFQRVEVRPRREDMKDNQIPLEVELQPRLPHQWRFGLGYATDTGARASVGMTRLMNSEGNKLQADLLVSENLRSISAAYAIPLADPTTEQLVYGWKYRNEITDTRNSHITGLNVSHLSLWQGWQRTIGLFLERELYVVGSEPEQTIQVLYPLVSIDRIQADDRLHPRHGSRIHMEFRGARSEIVSDTNYGQVRAGFKWIGELGEHGRVLVRGDAGSTNVAYLDKLPASQRFFAGGDNSVRGYSYQELGPKNELGQVVGGKHLLVGSVELEHQLAGNWSVAAFYDIGNAMNSTNDPLAHGAGAGLRWNSPVGPVRFDFAWSLDKIEDRFRLHVVLGPDL